MQSRKIRNAAILLALLAPCGRPSWAAIPSGILPIIYGQDDRREVYQATETHKQKAGSVAALFSFRLPQNDKRAEIKLDRLETLREAKTLCEKEPFGDQPIGAFCTGVLVGPDILLTAGHCFKKSGGLLSREQECQMTSFVFGFSYAAEKADPRTVKTEDIYTCKALVKSMIVDGAEDWAIVRLNQAVKGRAPLDVNLKQAQDDVKKGMPLYMIGHPLGLPAKVVANGKVSRVHRTRFESNLDTFAGNSGSPVFNAESNLIEGIVAWNPEEDLRECLEDHGATVYRSKKFEEEEGSSGATMVSTLAKDLQEALEASKKALEAEEKLKQPKLEEPAKKVEKKLEELPEEFDWENPK